MQIAPNRSPEVVVTNDPGRTAATGGKMAWVAGAGINRGAGMTYLDEERVLARAEKRLARVRGFIGHLLVYLAVMAILVVVDRLEGSNDVFLWLDWAFWPMVGWGAFVAIDGFSLLAFGHRWEQRKLEKYVQEERERELLDH